MATVTRDLPAGLAMNKEEIGMRSDAYVRFVPSRVEGLPAVSEVRVSPDRIEANSAGEWAAFRFSEIAAWPRPGWLWRLLHRTVRRPAGLPVGDRDWFHAPPDRYFSFYTEPRLVVYMPVDEAEDYEQSTFVRIRRILAAGGFQTLDLS